MSELEVTRVMSDLRGLYERGKLSDEQIARLDAIGFNWERKKRIKPTLDSRLAELWDEEKNGAVELVRLKQRDRYWWKCPICGCEWSRELGAALKSNLCPVCNGRVLVKGYNDLATTHPELAAEWDYDRNGELRPSDVLAGSTRAVWWKCSKCHGVWQCKVVNRKLNAVRCPYCRKKRLLKGFNDLASQYPELAKEYLPELNSGITADELLIRNKTTAIPRLREIFAGADEVIGYNVGFDLGFLSAVGVRPREDARITDTMKEFTWFMGRRYKLVDAADHIGYEWTGRAHGSLADALATLAVQRWLEQWLVAE